MKTLIYSILLISTFLATDILLAQSTTELAPCGTPNHRSAWLRAYQLRERGEARNEDLLYIAIQAHVVGTDNGTGYLPYDRLLAAFCTLQQDFEPSNIRFFFQGPVNYIDNSAYYNHDFSTGRRMMQDHNVPDVINCYFVENPAGACGYYSPSGNALTVGNGCSAPTDHTWAHEVGHYLSLPHPFFGWEFDDEPFDFNQPAPEFINGREVEKVDRSNCRTAGDGFCGTPPDYLSERWSCNGDSESRRVLTDPDGVSFRVDGRYIMSYSNDGCVDRFSDDQIDAMRANLEEQRAGHIAPRPELEDILIPPTEEVMPIFPTAEDVLTTREVTIAWEPVPNAESYIVQLNPFNIFSVVFNEFFVDEPRVTFNALVSDETYFWRVKPVNRTDSCHPFTRPNSFDTGTVVSSREAQLPANALQVYPNPVTNESFNLRVELGKVATGYWQLHNSRGQIVQAQSLQTSGFGQQQEISTAGLPGGIYWLRLVLDGKQRTQKVIVR